MQERTSLQTRKELGLAHLNADRIEEGLKIYAMILRDYPEDVESYVVIGDCYLAQGETQTAAQMYAYALELSPENPEIARRLRLAKPDKEPKPSGEAARVPELRTIGRLLQRIIGQTSTVTENDLNKAAQLLEEIKQSPRPALAVAEHLSDIETLIPAMLELNIRQARAEGRPDLAQALDDLLDGVHDQLGASLAESSGEAGAGNANALPMAKARVLILVPATYQISARAMFALKALSLRGYQTVLASERIDFNERYDVAIAFNPHGDAKLMELLAACAGAHIPVIIDLEHDFEQLPATHPAYAEFGLSSVEKTRVYTAAILLAERITTPSRCLAEKVETEGRKVSVVPHGWMMRNGLWQKPASRRHTVNLGWIGAAGEVEDVAEIRRMVLRVLREFPQTQLVIGGDAQVYQLFERLPESRRLFLPPVSMEDYPYLLGQVDILLAPMRETLYNQMRSDRRLMEAGARRIPWIASPIPAFLEWKVGGLIARTPEEWIDHLRQLILDADMRASLGQEGWKKAEGREINAVGDVWQRLIEGTLEKARKKV